MATDEVFQFISSGTERLKAACLLCEIRQLFARSLEKVADKIALRIGRHHVGVKDVEEWRIHRAK
jgi:hypothetical protein